MLLSRAQVREVDRRAIADYGLSGLVLMENAGRGCAEFLLGASVRGPVTIACGKGNNAGDGLVIARHLDNARIAVRLLLFADPAELTGDALVNFRIAERSGIERAECWQQQPPPAPWLAESDWLVDALLGTGASGPPRPPLDQAIRSLNASPGRKLAVDLPSGLDCDSGLPAEPTFRADHTCTFVAEKTGFRHPAAAPYLGRVHVVSIGAPRRLIEELAGTPD